ncbi:unnamed protein product, partial [Phaeothamnion confervicola]
GGCDDGGDGGLSAPPSPLSPKAAAAAAAAASAGLALTANGEHPAVAELWWPLLLGLAERIGDYRLDVRSAAISTLREVLKDYGGAFSARTHRAILARVLFPPMRHAAGDRTAAARLGSEWPAQGADFPLLMDSWIVTTTPQLFQTVAEVYLKNFRVAGGALPAVLEFFSWYACQQDVEIMSRLAVQALHQLTEGLALLPSGPPLALGEVLGIATPTPPSPATAAAAVVAATERRRPWLAADAGGNGDGNGEGDADLVESPGTAAGPQGSALVPPQLWTYLCDHIADMLLGCLVTDFGACGVVGAGGSTLAGAGFGTNSGGDQTTATDTAAGFSTPEGSDGDAAIRHPSPSRGAADAADGAAADSDSALAARRTGSAAPTPLDNFGESAAATADAGNGLGGSGRGSGGGGGDDKNDDANPADGTTPTAPTTPVLVVAAQAGATGGAAAPPPAAAASAQPPPAGVPA